MPATLVVLYNKQLADNIAISLASIFIFDREAYVIGQREQYLVHEKVGYELIGVAEDICCLSNQYNGRVYKPGYSIDQKFRELIHKQTFHYGLIW